MDIRLGRFLNKEQCQGCNKNILKHHKFAVCSHCNKIAHEKCALNFLILIKSMKNGNAGNVKVISQKGIIHSVVYSVA